MLNADGKRVHPLLILNERLGVSKMRDLLGHKNHSTAAIYVSRAKQRPTTRIPAEWILPMAKELDVRPHQLRPDLYLAHWRMEVSK
jgi:hypothetical protein